ncbi:MAG: transglycosylase SLT domain-containing protein [Nitrososphaerales archaeon]
MWGNKFLPALGLAVALAGFGLFKKVEEETENAYEKGQELVANQKYVDLNKLSEVARVSCNGLPLAAYFYRLAQDYNLPPQVIAIIPRESSGNPYATGCDPCGGSGGARLALSRQWIQISQNIGLCKGGGVCSIGYGLMQITSHTLEEYRRAEKINLTPYALLNSRIFYFRSNPSAIRDEPPQSPYNVCSNIQVGLLILRDKYKSCGGEGISRIACAVCRYNGNPKYLKALRETISKGGTGILVKLGFLKDDAVDIVKDFVVKIAGFFGFSVNRC